MFRGGSILTQAEQAVIGEEVKRIESIEGFKLTYDSLADIVLKVKAAGNNEHRRLQREGIEAARNRGVALGRPVKTRPENFPSLVDAIEAGELSRAAVAKTLGVSRETLRKWIKEHKENSQFLA